MGYFWSRELQSITRAYYKNSVCAIIIYDITNRVSFEYVNNWIEDIKNSSKKNIMIVLVGNRKELEKRREVTYEEGKELADKNGISLFYEIYEKNVENINNIFYEYVNMIDKKIGEGYYNLDENWGIKCGFEKNVIKMNEKVNKKCLLI